MVTLGVALFFWGVIALWLLSWALPVIVAAIRLTAELTLWSLLVVCGLGMLLVEVVQTLGAHFARRRYRRPIHISKFDMA